MEILNKIQKKLKAPKSQFNSFGKYKYRSCEDIVEAVKPLLNTATLTLTDEIVMIGDRYYVKATAMIKDGDISEYATAYAREPDTKKGMDESQITGSSSSYARKNALNGLFAIDDTKDADTQDNTQTPVQKKTSIIQYAINAIEKCKTVEEFDELYSKAEKSKKYTEDELKKINEMIDIKKTELKKTNINELMK